MIDVDTWTKGGVNRWHKRTRDKSRGRRSGCFLFFEDKLRSRETVTILYIMLGPSFFCIKCRHFVATLSQLR